MYKVTNGNDPLASINTAFTGYQKTVTQLDKASVVLLAAFFMLQQIIIFCLIGKKTFCFTSLLKMGYVVLKSYGCAGLGVTFYSVYSYGFSFR